MSRAALAAALALAALTSSADEIVLKDGRGRNVTQPIRIDGRIMDFATRGKTFSASEAELVSPPLWSLPLLVRLTDGREVPVKEIARKGDEVLVQSFPDGARRRIPSANVAAPDVATLPVQFELNDGRKLPVFELTRKDQSVRFIVAATAQKRQVPAAQVASPALDSIPWLMQLADGREMVVADLARKDDQVRFRVVATGDRRQVPAGQVLSPAADLIPLAPGTAVAAGPTPAPAPAPTPAAPVPTPPPPAAATTPPPTAVASTVPDFVRLTDRWSILDTLMDKLPPDPRLVRGRGIDPYNQNTLKGDRPVIGNSIFFVLTATLEAPAEIRRLPLPSGASAERPGSLGFFGSGRQNFTSPHALLSLELFKGQTAFRPKTWALRVTPAVDLNYLALRERGGVNIDPREGTTRRRQDAALEEAFGELKLADLSPNFDVVSLRAGIQPFVSDFRGFVFNDQNLGARLFGNASANRWQFNAAYFDLLEKDTNSELNTFTRREHKVGIANLFRQDFLAPGHTLLLSYHLSRDEASKERYFDANGFLVRPAKIGTPALHEIRAHYVGLASEGHLGRVNISQAYYRVFGTDSGHPLGNPEGKGAAQDLSAQLAALELSLDRDWARLRTSFFFASGDDDAEDGKGKGFDAIYDHVNFAGGPFSFWNRSGIPLTQTGVLLKTPGSLLPSLRSSKFEGQASFVNPGVLLANAGLDLELTPKLKAVLNASYLRFHKTGALSLLLFQPEIRKSIGFDLGGGFVYRPKLSENVVITAGATGLLPGPAFDDLFSSPCAVVKGCGSETPKLFNAFVQLKLSY
jgi:hypothetical protein